MELRDLCDRDPVTVAPDTTIATAAETMKSQNVGALIVLQDEKVCGIFTDRDVALALGQGQATRETQVSEIMTRKVVTIWEDQGIFNATQYFWGHKIRRLPVIDREDRLVGLITLDDLFALLARELFNVAKALEPSLGEQV